MQTSCMGESNTSFQQDRVPACLKEVSKFSLKATVLDNYQPASNSIFLGKVLESVVAFRLQEFLVDADYLSPFQPGFKTAFALEIVSLP